MNPQAVIPKVYPFKMESILNLKTQKVEAADYWLSQGKKVIQKLEVSLKEKRKQYVCPCCKLPVILKQGKRRIAYFAHPVLQDTQSCKVCATRVKPNKKKTEEPNPNKIPETNAQSTIQEENPKSRIIAFYPEYNNWDNTLGLSSVNYFVTSNELSENSKSTDSQKYNEFDDTFPGICSSDPSADNWEQISFDFPEDQFIPEEEQTNHVWDEEDLNIDWLLNRFGGKIPNSYLEISDRDLVKLIFEQKLSRSLNNLRTRILDLKITGFKLPENILDIMNNKGLIKRLEETSQVQFERAS